MRLWPRSLPGRVALVLSGALVTIVALDFAVHARDARAQPSPAIGEPAPSPPVSLPVVDGLVQFALRPASVPEDAVPVVQIFRGGGHALRRPLPLPDGPAAVRSVSPVVLLPAVRGGLERAGGATLAAVVGALVPVGPVPVGRFFTLDFPLEVAELERLLAWVR